MRDLVIMPAMAQRRESLNMGEFAEEAIIVEEVAAPKRVNHFIEANTQEVTLQHLQQDCIIPSFASMEETISHQSFIGAVVDAAKDYFHGEQFDMPEIRISHPINGRTHSLRLTSAQVSLTDAGLWMGCKHGTDSMLLHIVPVCLGLLSYPASRQ